MKQMLDTAATLPPVFPLDCAEDNYGCAERSAGIPNVRRLAATVRIAPPAAAYAESGRARCSWARSAAWTGQAAND